MATLNFIKLLDKAIHCQLTYLFILVIEILSVQIRSQRNIKGITFGNKETKLSIFADDLTAFLQDKTSYNNLI